jgi:hypothetical protein
LAKPRKSHPSAKLLEEQQSNRLGCVGIQVFEEQSLFISLFGTTFWSGLLMADIFVTL